MTLNYPPLLASRGQRSRRTGRYLVSHRELPGIFLGLSGEELAAPAALQARKFAASSWAAGTLALS